TWLLVKICPSSSRITPDPEPSSCSPPTDKVTTDGEATAAASVVGVTLSVRFSCGDCCASLLATNFDELMYSAATPPTPPPNPAPTVIAVMITGHPKCFVFFVPDAGAGCPYHG